MTHPYAVVYFKDEESYSEIPAHWILSDETCWWPECKNIASLILRKAVPNENGQWKKYNIEVVGFYASLEAARRKAIDSDCSSDDGNMGKGLRKKKRSIKIHSDSSEEDDYRERTPPPSLKTKVHRETPNINILENSFVENTSKESNKFAELASSASEDIGIDGNNTLVADIPKHQTQLDLLEGKIDKLSIMMKKILIYVKGIEDRLSQNEKFDKNMEINVDIILGKLPLESVEGIMDLEASINDDKDLRERFMNYLKNIGGRTTKEMVSRILAKLMKNCLGVQCSLLGKRNHFRFKDLKLMDVIISNLIAVLADPYDIRVWNSCGLPRDSVSTENAILVTQAGRWPLMIDPQEQANRWIRQMEADKSLKIIKLTDSNFMRILETAVTIGMPVLLEEVGETLDPTLGPILLKQTFLQGGRLLIRLGESDVEYSENFRFYITSKLANPHYLPEICIQVTIVNFTVTLSGLEDQLLADVVRLERPDLETQRTELIVRINADKAQLKSIEDKILYLLYHSEGNILDDEELIETLNESKETSAIIEARLIETEATEEKISIAREKYRLVAIRGSVLYFVVAELADIDPMYQYSLKYFNQVFNNVIEVSEKHEILEQRLTILLREITIAVYTIISRGLFERHKLVYSFMLCIAVLQQNGLITDLQWNFLLRGPVGTKATLPKKPDYPTITDAIWTAANYLSYSYEHFEGLQNDLLRIITVQIGDYRLEIQLVERHSNHSKVDWNKRLDDFDKLMLIKSVAEEKLIFAITEYVKIKLGKIFIESPQASLPVLYQDTNNGVPLIFILSTGSDPFGAFQRFAAEMEYGSRVKSISLGQGQGPVAEKLIQDAVETGDWVFLQNCHLATSWMLSMERIVLAIARDTNKVHKQFRLYMSSMPSKSFPVSVLQNSVKVTNEPPKGLRANIKRAFSEMDRSFFEDHSLDQQWKAMLFGLCTFHAVVQERKKFGPLGWNIIYEFNDSDRDFAFNTLKMFCADGFIPWDALEYLTGEITYGGRVTDYWDLRCLKTILKIFFSPQILKPDYVYSSSGTYYCPIYSNIDDYRIFVDNLPIIEEPEIFGMHENANIAYQVKETNSVIRTIVECQPRASAGAEGRSSDDIVYELAEGILGSVIPKIPTDDVNVHMYKKDKKGRVSSLTTVLTQEIDRYDKLLKLIHSSMKQLQKAIKGLVVMSDDLEKVFTAFMNNQVPEMWNKIAYNSLKTLGSWSRDLILRLDFISVWVRYGPPTSYWISGFYFPQGFLTGTLQTHARKYNLPIDELKYDFILHNYVLDQEDVYRVHITEEKEVYEVYNLYEQPIDGVIIHGLFVDAGRWDFKNEELIDAKPGEINPPLPLMWLKPSRTFPAQDPRYVAPLYKTSVRAGVLSTTGHSTNFVIAVLLPTKQHQEYWILKGTALLTQITD